MKVQTILLSGKQGSGKTTLAELLVAELHKEKSTRVFNLRFAETIYRIHDYARNVLAAKGLSHPPGKEEKDGDLLQYLGTEWGRHHYGSNVWVDCTLADIQRQTEIEGRLFDKLYFVISDARFPNEFNAFSSGLRVRLVASEGCRKRRAEMWRENTNHLSETALDEFANDGLFDLYLDTEQANPMACAADIIDALQKKGFEKS